MSRRPHHREWVLGGLVLSLMLLIGVRAPVFLSWESLDALLTDVSILTMMALAQMLVILTRGIDLSVASNLALSGMVVALLGKAAPDLPLLVLIALAVLNGAVLGIVNGGLIAGLGIPPIVVTLGTLSMFRGLIFVISGGEWISSHEMPAAFLDFPRERLLGLTHLAWLALLMLVLVHFLLKHSRIGRELYALGGNPKAAVYVGIPIARRQLFVYTFTGAVSGLCGYLWVARYAIAYTEIASGFELQVIAACVIGGVSIAGGIGSVAGCVLGALFLGVINNALPVINVSPFWQMAISGAVILAAVVVNSREEKQQGKRILPVSEAPHG